MGLASAMEVAVLTLELRGLLFALLVALIAAVNIGAWLARRRRGRWGALIDLPDLGEVDPGLEQAPIGLLVLQGARAYRYANRYARRLLGLAAPAGHLPEVPWSQLMEEDRLAMRQGGVAAGRYRTLPLPTGSAGPAEPPSQFVRWWVAPVAGQDLAVLWDLTPQQRAEEAGRSLVNDLSHELRTPLATMLTHLEVLSLPSISADTRNQSIGLLKAEAHRMARLVHQLLELGRLETSAELEQRPVDLLALAEQAVAQVAPQAEERGIALSLEAATPLALALGDSDRLRQVLLNLLDNAVKYCRSGDRVVVYLEQEGESIHCAVHDSGPGIPAVHLPHLTRRFYRAAPQAVEGSGLGLALAQEILRRHQSRLEIESYTEGQEKGTRAHFRVPIAPS